MIWSASADGEAYGWCSDVRDEAAEEKSSGGTENEMGCCFFLLLGLLLLFADVSCCDEDDAKDAFGSTSSWSDKSLASISRRR